MLAPSAALGTLRLESELIRLQQDFNVYPSIVRLTVRATLLDASTRAVIASREFDEREASLSEDASGGAAAGQRAIQRLLTEFSAFFSQQARLRPSAAGSDE
jgi:cholesterol transport system auxiliary component